MKRDVHVKNTSSLKMLRLFLLVVGVVIAASLLFRAIVIIKNSNFDGSKPYILAFSYKNTLDLVVIKPDEKMVSRLIVRHLKDVNDAVGDLGIPWDTKVVLKEPLGDDNGASVLFGSFRGLQVTGKNLTAYDFYRLGFAIKEFSSKTTNKESIDFSEKENLYDDILTEVFSDKNILSEGKTISIVNATGTSGIGSKLESVLTHLGGSVIAVENGEKISQTSSISYHGDGSYTTERVGKLLKIKPLRVDGKGLSDILIVLGEDKASNLF